MKPFLTRKDIARMLMDISVDQVRKNEKPWGLDACRCDLNERVVRYNTPAVILAFQKRGLTYIIPTDIEKANPLKYF